MRVALSAAQHWHAPMHAAAFAQAGAPFGLLHSSDLAEVLWDGAAALPRVDSLDALAEARPDLVVVLGRPDEMLRTTRFLIERSIPVAVEKPVGTDPAALHALAELARERRAFVSVAQPHLLNEFWAQIPDDPGPMSHFRFRLINGSPGRYPQWGVPWVLDRSVGGGGVLRNLGIHGVSAFQQLVKGAGHLHSALLSNVLYGLEVEEYASLTLRSGSAIGHIEAGYTLGSDQDSEFEMTAHWQHLSIRDDGQALHLLNRQTGERTVKPCLPLPRRYEQFARATLDALQGQSARVHDLDAHAQAMALIDQAYARAEWVRA